MLYIFHVPNLQCKTQWKLAIRQTGVTGVGYNNNINLLIPTRKAKGKPKDIHKTIQWAIPYDLTSSCKYKMNYFTEYFLH
ncbi:hypothetical protein XENTR_v10016214 [Xenopus tropicalis]|nr:hypothetical protein XENTR_v10016214 [Xenopus tropicalis]